MKILGLIGGISWVSTLDYYKLINQGINDKLGGLNASHCIIYSFNYEDIKKNNDNNDWETTFQMFSNAGKHLKSCGATGIVLCANTAHFIADRLEQEIGLPIIHIATATATEIQKTGLKKLACLGQSLQWNLTFLNQNCTTNKLKQLYQTTTTENLYIRQFLTN